MEAEVLNREYQRRGFKIIVGPSGDWLYFTDNLSLTLQELLKLENKRKSKKSRERTKKDDKKDQMFETGVAVEKSP